MNPPRQRTVADVETAVLANSARRCALCFHLDGDLTEQHGQIAHLDGDRSNSAEDNLAFMCLKHHSLYDSTTRQHKNYTIQEVKAARTKLYELVATGNHLSPATAQPYLQAEVDKKILRDILEMVPSNGSIHFLRDFNFAGFSFDRERLESLDVFLRKRDGPEHEFLDPDLEMARGKFRKELDTALEILALSTFVTERGFQSVPQDWEWENPKLFKDTVNEIHAAAKAAGSAYDELIRLARKKLAV
jgi:hypothetical protein